MYRMNKKVTREIEILCCDQCLEEIPENKTGYTVWKSEIDTWENEHTKNVHNDSSVMKGSEKVLCLMCIKKFYSAEADFIDRYFSN